MDKHRQWLADFFSEPNQWDLKKINGDGYNIKLQDLLQQMLLPVQGDKLPAVLPRLGQDKVLWFYIVGKDAQQLTELRGILNAYLGGAYVDLQKMVYDSTSDALEKIILAQYSNGFMRLKIHKPKNEDKNYTDLVLWVIETLNRIIKQYNDRPSIFSTIRRPTGRILRDFFTACNHNDYKASLIFLDELVNRQHLSQRNLVFLELQALAAGMLWNRLLEHPSLPDLMSTRMPRRIVMLILRAIGSTTLNPDNLEDYKVENLCGQLAHLDSIFTRPPDMADSPVYLYEWKCWSIGATAFHFERALESWPESFGSEWRNRLARWASLDAKPQGLSIDELIRKTPSLEVAILLLKEVLTATDDQKRRIVSRIDSYSKGLQKRLFENVMLFRLWESVKNSVTGGEQLADWSELFRYISSAKDSSKAILMAIENSDHWVKSTWDEAALVELLERVDVGSSQIRDLLPILIPWLQNQDIQLKAESIELLLLNFVTDDSVSIQDLNLCGDLIEALIFSKHSKTDYHTAIEAIEVCWGKVKSHAAINAMFDIVDLLIDAPCADPKGREKVWINLQEFLLADWVRLDMQQKLLARQFSNELTQTCQQFSDYEPGAIAEGFKDATDLAGKKLAIYTLTEGAGRRAKAVLEALYPGIKIFLNHDKTATEALVHLAKNADHFIFSANSATHQAFRPVNKLRSDNILYPAGKGASSIVNVFVDFVPMLSINDSSWD